MAKPKEPAPVDVEVGRRVRSFRVQKGISQQVLADALGVTFQQVQKYEKGKNRIGPSRLSAIAAKLGAPVSAFFPSMDKGGASQQQFDLLQDRQTVELATAFNEITSPQTRAAILHLVASIVDQQ